MPKGKRSCRSSTTVNKSSPNLNSVPKKPCLNLTYEPEIDNLSFVPLPNDTYDSATVLFPSTFSGKH